MSRTRASLSRPTSHDQAVVYGPPAVISPAYLAAQVERGRQTGCGCAASAMRLQAAGRNTDNAAVMDENPEAPVMGDFAVNAQAVWAMYTNQLYSSLDTLTCAIREMHQNSRDAILAAVKAGQLRSEEDGVIRVSWAIDPERHNRATLVFEDNGIGMSCTLDGGRPRGVLPEKFMAIGESGKGDLEDSAGGFGAAKAVILGVGKGGWEIHTRGVIARLQNGRIAYARAATERQGASFTLYGVEWEPDRSMHGSSFGSGSYMPPEERVLTQLRGSGFLGTIWAGPSGQESKLRPYFPMGAGRAPRQLNDKDAWLPSNRYTTNDMNVRVGVIDRTDGLRGRVWVRLNGILQWADPFHAMVTKDVIVDVQIKGKNLKPGNTDYPFPVSRDQFRYGNAYYELRRIREHLERESQSSTIDEEWTVIEPDSENGHVAAEAQAYGKLFAAAMQDIRGSLDELAASAAAVARAEKLLGAHAAPLSLAGTNVPGQSPTAEQTALSEVPEDMRDMALALRNAARLEAAQVARKGGPRARMAGADMADLGEGEDGDEESIVQVTHLDDGTAVVKLVVSVVSTMATAAGVTSDVTESDAHGPMTPDVARRVLDTVRRAQTPTSRADQRLPLTTVARSLAAVVPYAEAALPVEERKQRRKAVNPFGALAAIHVHREYGTTREQPPADADSKAVEKFKRELHRKAVRAFYRSPKKHVPTILLWDLTTRLIAATAQTLPAFRVAFLLEDGVAGRAGKGVAMINPDYARVRIEANRERPQAIAAWFYQMACHELAHLRATRHEEEFSKQREGLADRTASVIPLIEEAVVHILGLKPTRVPKIMLTKAEKAAETAKAAQAEAEKRAGDLQVRLNRAAFERDQARQREAALQDRITAAEGTTPQQSAMRIGALAALADFRHWIRTYGPRLGFDVAGLEAAMDQSPDALVTYLLGEGSAQVTRYMRAIGDG